MYLLDRYRWRRAHRILMQDGLGFGLLSLLNRRIWSVANEILFDRKPCRGHLWVFSLCQDYQCSILLTFLSPYPSRSLAIYQCCSFETRYLGQFPKILRSNTRTESCMQPFRCCPKGSKLLPLHPSAFSTPHSRHSPGYQPERDKVVSR